MTLFSGTGRGATALTFPRVSGPPLQPYPTSLVTLLLGQVMGATHHPQTPGSRSPCGHHSCGTQGLRRPSRCPGPLQVRPHLHVVVLMAPQR